jgi:hypothetical protein
MIKAFWAWVRPTFEGPDGLVSHRKLTVFYFMWLLTYMVFETSMGIEFPEIAWVVVSGGAGLFSSLSLFQGMQNNKMKEQ